MGSNVCVWKVRSNLHEEDGLCFLDLFLVHQEKHRHMTNLGLLLGNRHGPHMEFKINFQNLSFH
jgi:hypothetical protein